MGGCATKPKVLKAEMDIPPAPEESEKIVEKSMVEIAGQKIDMVGEDQKVDDENEQGNRRRSLSNLFKEAEDEGKECKETNEKAETECKIETDTLLKKVKEAEKSDTKTATVESETEILEITKPENPTEEPDTKTATVETEILEIPKPESPTEEPDTKTATVEPEFETPEILKPENPTEENPLPVVEVPEIAETVPVVAVPEIAETEKVKVDGTEDPSKEEKKTEDSELEEVAEKEQEAGLPVSSSTTEALGEVAETK